MANTKKEKTVMVRMKVTDHALLRRLAHDEEMSIPDKLSDIINRWKVDQAKKYSGSTDIWRA